MRRIVTRDELARMVDAVLTPGAQEDAQNLLAGYGAYIIGGHLQRQLTECREEDTCQVRLDQYAFAVVDELMTGSSKEDRS